MGNIEESLYEVYKYHLSTPERDSVFNQLKTSKELYIGHLDTIPDCILEEYFLNLIEPHHLHESTRKCNSMLFSLANYYSRYITYPTVAQLFEAVNNIKPYTTFTVDIYGTQFLELLFYYHYNTTLLSIPNLRSYFQIINGDAFSLRLFEFMILHNQLDVSLLHHFHTLSASLQCLILNMSKSCDILDYLRLNLTDDDLESVLCEYDTVCEKSNYINPILE